MGDFLTQAYEKYKAKNPDRDELPFTLFQAGFTAGAVAMRDRAVKAAQSNTDQNETINAIGQLSDIPQL